MASSSNLENELEDILVKIKRNTLRGSTHAVASAIVNYLRKFIAQSRHTSLEEMLEAVREEGRKLQSADETEFVIGNMTLSVLKLMREEKQRMELGSDQSSSVAFLDPADSLHKLWDRNDLRSNRGGSTKELRQSIVDTLGEFLQEMETAREFVSAQGSEQIRPRGEVILTLGESRTAAAFFRRAACEGHKFELLVAENAPFYTGASLVSRLKSGDDDGGGGGGVKGVSLERCRCVGDGECVALMPSVSKVVFGARAVLADGAFIGPAGARALCLAARRYSVPVIVCACFYKLTPKFLSADDWSEFDRLTSPANILPFSQGKFVEHVDVYASSFDYVPAELVSLYIMQATGNSPSYVHRMLSEYYHPEDISKYD